MNEESKLRSVIREQTKKVLMQENNKIELSVDRRNIEVLNQVLRFAKIDGVYEKLQNETGKTRTVSISKEKADRIGAAINTYIDEKPVSYDEQKQLEIILHSLPRMSQLSKMS
jgi:hypothetical protein